MSNQHPIVFLPGVMGSRLYFPRSRRFWDPDRATRMGWWIPFWPIRSDDDNRRDLHFHEPGGVVLDTADVSPAEKKRGWSTVVWSYYCGMLKKLEEVAAPAEVYAIGYDWRQDIRRLGAEMAAKFRHLLGRPGVERIHVVTHSMGGLVLRAALRLQPALGERIATIVHVCQPSAGAVILYRRLFTGLVPGLDGGNGLADRGFRLLLGTKQASFLANMSGMPGPMQLLPSGDFPPILRGGAGIHFFPPACTTPSCTGIPTALLG
jgi:pimeloyl-ACP methyl ester carboxylesterase